MFDEKKLEAIRQYLETEFNTFAITDRYKPDSKVQEFSIVESYRIYPVTISGEFIEENDALAITAILKNYNFKGYFEKEGVRAIAFTSYREVIEEY
jgi:hypothetical protein